MTEQQKEIETISPREYKLNLSDADVERIAKTAGSYGMTVSELLENFIGDLVNGTYTNGSDERMYAQQWAERCWFSYDQDKSLVKYLCDGWDYEFSDLLGVLDRIESIKADIVEEENHIEDAENLWDHYTRNGKPAYKNADEFIEDKKMDLEMYKDEMEQALENLEDIKKGFDAYMKEKSYDWGEQVEKVKIWYRENVTDKM